MQRPSVDYVFEKIDRLVAEVNHYAPSGTQRVQEFRADLAGLLVVSITAAYEECVKEILVSYADRKNEDFGVYVKKQYERLSSRIRISDLKNYANTFGDSLGKNFSYELNRREKRIEHHTRRQITSSYGQMISWRHDYAHAWRRNTTVEEASTTHRLARWVIYCFNDVFEAG